MKCKYCNGDMISIAENVEEYGDDKFKCIKCGAIAEEVFGHGLCWKPIKVFVRPMDGYKNK